jgi:hypothetical protein
MIPFPRTLAIAASLVGASSGIAAAQRGSRGTMGVPRVVTAPAPAPAPSPSSSGRGVMGVPAHPAPTGPRGGDLPRITTRPGSGYARSYRPRSAYGGGSTYGGGFGYGNGSASGTGFSDGYGGHRFEPGTSRRWRPGYTTWGYGAGCSIGCFRIGVGGRTSRFFGSFSIGYPFAIPVFVPFFYGTTVERYVETAPEAYYEPEPSRAASKLIVIGGGTGGGGDALTIETVGDSVRLQWLGAGRAAREVKLFVADSAQRPLATRSASPSAPTATFEVATLSAPVAYAGVTVTFADGVTSTTLVPYRSGQR